MSNETTNKANAMRKALSEEIEQIEGVKAFAEAHQARYGYCPPLKAIERYLILQGLQVARMAEIHPEIYKTESHEPTKR